MRSTIAAEELSETSSLVNSRAQTARPAHHSIFDYSEFERCEAENTDRNGAAKWSIMG
jgi:hypothetical protein